MTHFISNTWAQHAASGGEFAHILSATQGPEGVDVSRMRFRTPGSWALADLAQVFSIHSGQARLVIDGESMALSPGSHVYLPAGHGARLDCQADTGLVMVHSAFSRGKRWLLRHERFLRASSEPSLSLRWTLTPQYLSRRVFLRHDQALLSKAGDPLSWFRTTMFDTRGLGLNADGESVFKMSYNSRTEFNVCYDVNGDARVRIALHPYAQATEQRWQAWHTLDANTTYTLNEAAGGPEEERTTATDGRETTLRNKHEVFADGGHVSLFCAFDPAPVGIERHAPGEYSDYEPLARVQQSPAFAPHQAALARYDEMVDELSLAAARGRDITQCASYPLFQQGEAAQDQIEAALLAELEHSDPTRHRVLGAWTGGREDR